MTNPNPDPQTPLGKGETTMATKLNRVALQAPPKDVSEETRKLAREAYAVLNYRGLLDDIGEPTERLSTVLQRLGIHVFSAESVSQYKEEKLDAARKRFPKDCCWWREDNIRNASGVPAFVLRKAIQIQLAAPEAKLYVETLDHDPDPSLFVKQGNEKFYVEVWHEPEFERAL